MPPSISISRVNPGCQDEPVCHFDELSDNAKNCLIETVENGMTARVDPQTAAELVQYDLIKFVSYYSVRFTEAEVSSSVSA